MSITFEVTIDCSNDAFQPSDTECDHEVARILRVIADKVEAGEYSADFMRFAGITTYAKTLHDSNGNDVGRATYRRTA